MKSSQWWREFIIEITMILIIAVMLVLIQFGVQSIYQALVGAVPNEAHAATGWKNLAYVGLISAANRRWLSVGLDQVIRIAIMTGLSIMLLIGPMIAMGLAMFMTLFLELNIRGKFDRMMAE